MKRWPLLIILIISGLLIACSTSSTATKKVMPSKAKMAKEKEQHPPLSSQEKLTPCSQCHKEATPQIYKEWYSSLHGLDNVKCFQCHGTFEDFHVTPPVMKCEACHAQEVEKMTVKKACWECHPAHGFKEHK